MYLVYEMIVQLNEELEDWREIVQMKVTPEELEDWIKRSEMLQYMISDFIDFVPVLESESNKKHCRITTKVEANDENEVSTKRKTKRKSDTEDIFTNNGKVNLTVDYQLKDINARIRWTNKRLIYDTNKQFWDVIIDQNCKPSHAEVTYVGIDESGNPISSSSSSSLLLNNKYTCKLQHLLDQNAPMYKPP